MQPGLLIAPRAKRDARKSGAICVTLPVDEGRPLEPTCRSRTQITFRCCVLTDVVVSGEGKGPEGKFGSDDFQEGDRKGTTVIVSKIAKMMSKPR